MKPTITPEELNACVRRFSASQKAFMRSERRAALRSLLFDVPRRSSLGWHCIYEKAAALLAKLPAGVSPEEIGRRMKRLGSRPNYLQLSILLCSYLGARQQLLLDAGLALGARWPEEKFDQALAVVDFWRRVARSYRNDAFTLPAEGGHTQPILPPNAVAALTPLLVPTSPEDGRRLRRLAATLELYSFLLHGEQRDGMFAHGPYPLGGAAQLVVQEFNDLQNTFMPWARTATRNPYPNLAFVMRLEGVRARFDMFGGVLFDPADILPRIAAQGLFTRDEVTGDVRPVPLAEIEAIQHAAAEAQDEIFQVAASWSPRARIEYGVDLFANHFRSFFHLAGLGDSMDDEIRREFHAAAAPLLDRLQASAEPPSIWKFMAATEDEYFWPLVFPGQSRHLTSSLPSEHRP
jgi:hypothetical protein